MGGRTQLGAGFADHKMRFSKMDGLELLALTEPSLQAIFPNAIAMRKFKQKLEELREKHRWVSRQRMRPRA